MEATPGQSDIRTWLEASTRSTSVSIYTYHDVSDLLDAGIGEISSESNEYFYADQLALYSSDSDFLFVGCHKFSPMNEHDILIDVDNVVNFLVDRPEVKTEAAIFDIGGVLHAYNESDAIDTLANGTECDREVAEVIWHELLIPELGTGNIDEASFWKRAEAEYSIDIKTPFRNSVLIANTIMEQIVNRRLTESIIHSLGSSGITLALLSNTIEAHARILDRVGMYEYFDYKFFSYEMRKRKPDPQVFAHVLAELDVNPEEVIYFDDNWENVLAAQHAGISRAYQFITMNLNA